MAVDLYPLDGITKIVTDDRTSTIEMIKVIQQLIAAIRDLEERVTALEP